MCRRNSTLRRRSGYTKHASAESAVMSQNMSCCYSARQIQSSAN
eukprot:IDg20059t1